MNIVDIAIILVIVGFAIYGYIFDTSYDFEFVGWKEI